jgi:hypothetical protein
MASMALPFVICDFHGDFRALFVSRFEAGDDAHFQVARVLAG